MTNIVLSLTERYTVIINAKFKYPIGLQFIVYGYYFIILIM